MERLKKVFAVALCLLTVALCAIVNTSAYTKPPTSIEMGTRQGFYRFTINDYLLAYILIDWDSQDTFGHKTSVLVLAQSYGEANLVAEKWRKETAHDWQVWGNDALPNSAVNTFLTYTPESGSQRIALQLSAEYLTESNLYYDIGYAPMFVINLFQRGDGTPRNLWVGEDYDFMRHLVQQDATSGGDPVYQSYWGIRYYDDFENLDEVTITSQIYTVGYDDVGYTAQISQDEIPWDITQYSRPVYSVRSFADGEYDRGKTDGYAIGYKDGYEDGSREQTVTEFNWIDLINGIVQAPVSFLKTALDFEIFGINMAGFAMFIVSALIILGIVTVLLKVVI